MEKLFYIIAAIIAFNMFVWGVTKMRKEILLNSVKINRQLDKIEKNGKEILEMLDRRAGK